MPIFHSNRKAPAKLFLDFNGRVVPSWGNVVVPPFDYVDHFPSVLEICERIAEDYGRLHVDVTNEDPGNELNRQTAIVAIGGAYGDWYGPPAGGVAYVGGFYNAAPNVGFAFSRSLGNNLKYIAEAASHEGGHLFGLQHQSLWDGSVKLAEYHPGDANWAPIMGVGYYALSTTWTIGRTPSGATQDDLKILSGPLNGFGFRQVQFTIQLPTTPAGVVASILTISINGGPVAIHRLEPAVTSVSAPARAYDVVAAELVYENAAGKRSRHPLKASLVL